jgi:hypothetical protein
LGAIISGVAALIGILLAISLVVLQLAAEKYSHRMVRFLIQEKVGGYVIDFLVIALLFSTWTLFLLNRGTAVPFVSIIVALTLGTLSIVFVFVYRDYSLTFFRPKQGFEAVALEAKKSILTVFKKGDKLGISVTKHLQEKTLENIQVIFDFINILAKNNDSEVRYGSMNLAGVLSLYITEKRFIDTESGWFPTIEIPSSQNHAISYELLEPFEELALGERYIPKPDTEWLEKLILMTIRHAHNEAIKNNDLPSISSIIEAYKVLVDNCFTYQEFAVLDRTVANLRDFAEVASTSGRLKEAGEFYNVMLLISEKAISGIGSSKLHEILTNISWRSEKEIASLKLPKIYNDELLAFQKKIETEILIEKTIVTPKERIEEEITQRILSIEQELSRKYYDTPFEILEKLFLDNCSKKLQNEIRNVLLVELRALRRAIVLNKSYLASKNIEKVSIQSAQGYESLGDNRIARHEIFTELKLGCLNAIKSKDIASLAKFYDTLVLITSMEFEDGDNFFPEEALESLMTIAALAFLHSEFYQDKIVFCTIVGLLYKKFDLKILATVFDFLLKRTGLTYSMELTTKYHHWFRDIFLKISDLPMVTKDRSTSFIGVDVVCDHPSDFIQNSQISIDIEDCIKGMIKKLQELITS